MTTVPDPNEEFESLRCLVVALGYDCDEEDDPAVILEGYVVDYLDVDLGMGLFVSQPGDSQLHLQTNRGVSMWGLEFPVTRAEFYNYLDELDLRSKRMDAILELPGTNDGDEAIDSDEQVSVTAVLAELLRATESDVIDQLGSDWRSLESDAGGHYSNPVRFLLWRDRLIVGLDDEYVHLFTPALSHHTVQVDEVLGGFELGATRTLTLMEFAAHLRTAEASLGPTEHESSHVTQSRGAE